MSEVTKINKTQIRENNECSQIENENKLIIKQFSDVIDTIFCIVDETINNDKCTVSISKAIKKSLKNALYESAKLKSLGLMKLISKEKLAKLLQIMIKFIKDGNDIPVQFKNNFHEKDNCQDNDTIIKSQITSIVVASDAVISSLYIMTSPSMAVDVFLEDVINEILLFTQYHLKKNVFPSFDAMYSQEIKENLPVKKNKGQKDSSRNTKKLKLQILDDRLQEIISLLSELVRIKKLTDKDVFLLSDIGLAPFFVNNVNKLQLSALKLITSLFEKNEMHRRLILEDIIQSVSKMSKIELSFNNYKLFSSGRVQMLTALLLLLVQCTVTLPEQLPTHSTINVKGKSSKNTSEKVKREKERDTKEDNLCKWDHIISCKYKDAVNVAGYFLNSLLNKCAKNKNEVNYRTILDTFLLDIITILNNPEWPVSELLLDLFGRLLISHIKNKNSENSLRIIALDYLGNIATAIKREMMMLQSNMSTIADFIDKVGADFKIQPKGCSKKIKMDAQHKYEAEDWEVIYILQKFLLNYLKTQGESDRSFLYARHFYIAQWFKDADNIKTENKTEEKSRENKRKQEAEEKKSKHKHHKGTGKMPHKSKKGTRNESKLDRFSQKQFLISQVKPSRRALCEITPKGESNFYVDYETTKHITRFLALKRPFYKYFDIYLKQILLSLAEANNSIRTKAMKCLTAIVEADPSTLVRADVHIAVCSSFLDHSILVRGNAVDLVGKYVLSHFELLGKYYSMLSQRILDTGMSVRKRVIKILKDIYIKYPKFDKNEEICIKIIRRFMDENSIQKLVTAVFQEMWFNTNRAIENSTASQSSSCAPNLVCNAISIIKAVAVFQENDMILFEKLLFSIFKPCEVKSDGTRIPQEPSKALWTNFKGTVNCLMDYTLQLEEETAGSGDGLHSSKQHLVSCLQTLQTFAKICPEFLVSHVCTLQPYLSIKCQTNGDLMIIKCVVQILEVVIPLIEHPSEIFLSSLEEDMVKLVFRHEPAVVQSCLSCLSTLNKMTKNYKLILDIFEKFYSGFVKYKKSIGNKFDYNLFENLRPYVRRCIFTVGVFFQYFDFLKMEGVEKNIVQNVFSLLIYIYHKQDNDLQNYCLKALGAICRRHYDFMLNVNLTTVYEKLLSCSDAPIHLVIQVLNNLLLYLKEEEIRLMMSDKSETGNDLKTIGNNSCDIASRVIQVYQRSMLQLLIHENCTVRHTAILLFQAVLQQGLIEPIQVIPYLISTATDEDCTIKTISEELLNNIEKVFPRLVFTKCQLGLELSFIFQKRLQSKNNHKKSKKNSNMLLVVEGFRSNEHDTPEALNSYVYRLYKKSKKSGRALIKVLLKSFEREIQVSFPELLYLAHNLAYFPYESQDEVLFVIHNIDFMVPLNGRNIIDNFENSLLPEESLTQVKNNESDEIEDNIEEYFKLYISRIPKDTTILQNCISATHSYILLVDLKEYLKNIYGVSREKIMQYSPGNCIKASEKNIIKHNNISKFTTRIISEEQNVNWGQDNPELLNNEDLIKKFLEFRRMILDFDEG